MKRYEALAASLGLSYDQKLSVLYGTNNGVKMVIRPVGNNAAFLLSVSLSRKNQLPDAETMKQAVASSKGIAKSQLNGHEVVFSLRGARTNKKTATRLKETMETLTQFLKQHDFESCCQFCGKTDETVGIFAIGGQTSICCAACFKQQSAALSKSQYDGKQKKESLLAGSVGAFLGSLIGVAAIVLLGQLGYVAALSGIVMAICTFKGYELFGGRISGKGILLSIVVMVLMIYFGHRLDWAISVANYYSDIDIFYGFQLIPGMVRDGYLEAGTYYGNLILVYLFTIGGAIPTILGIQKERKLAQESYQLDANN